MRIMYCWRCRLEVAMLDEDEFAKVDALYDRAVKETKEKSRLQPEGTKEESIMERYRPVLDAYRQITGREHATHPSDLMHHRISKYGPLCVQCGKPLRTPKATYCAACGTNRTDASICRPNNRSPRTRHR